MRPIRVFSLATRHSTTRQAARATARNRTGAVSDSKNSLASPFTANGYGSGYVLWTARRIASGNPGWRDAARHHPHQRRQGLDGRTATPHSYDRSSVAAAASEVYETRNCWLRSCPDQPHGRIRQFALSECQGDQASRARAAPAATLLGMLPAGVEAPP
jgi:hypothetical protein